MIIKELECGSWSGGSDTDCRNLMFGVLLCSKNMIVVMYGCEKKF
jgi:hypothetical protein